MRELQSILIYYWRNKRRVVPILVVLILAVFGMTLSGSITGSIRHSALEGIELYRRVATVTPVGCPEVESEIKAMIRDNAHTDDLIRFVGLRTYSRSLIGNNSVQIFAIRKGDQEQLLQSLKLKLMEGRLPDKGAAEIALHEAVARNRSLGIGSEVGTEVERDDSLPGRFRVVGLLQGPVMTGIASREYLIGRPRFPSSEGLAVIPRDGLAPDLDRYLSELSGDEFTTGTYSIWYRRTERFLENMDIVLWVLNVFIVSVLSIAVALLNVVHFMQRMGEFGLLAALGYSRWQLVRRTLLEVLGITIVSWALGLILSEAIYRLLNLYIFDPRGLSLDTLNWRIIRLTLPAPILITTFSVGTVLYYLLHLDPVTIIERRE